MFYFYETDKNGIERVNFYHRVTCNSDGKLLFGEEFTLLLKRQEDKYCRKLKDSILPGSRQI